MIRFDDGRVKVGVVIRSWMPNKVGMVALFLPLTTTLAPPRAGPFVCAFAKCVEGFSRATHVRHIRPKHVAVGFVRSPRRGRRLCPVSDQSGSKVAALVGGLCVLLTHSGSGPAKFAVLHNATETATMRPVEPGQGNETALQNRPRTSQIAPP
jgi:hypothetical protein